MRTRTHSRTHTSPWSQSLHFYLFWKEAAIVMQSIPQHWHIHYPRVDAWKGMPSVCRVSRDLCTLTCMCYKTLVRIHILGNKHICFWAHTRRIHISDQLKFLSGVTVYWWSLGFHENLDTGIYCTTQSNAGLTWIDLMIFRATGANCMCYSRGLQTCQHEDSIMFVCLRHFSITFLKISRYMAVYIGRLLRNPIFFQMGFLQLLFYV